MNLLHLSLSKGQSVETNDNAAQSKSGKSKTNTSNNLVTGLLEPSRVGCTLKGASSTLDLFHFIDLQHKYCESKKVSPLVRSTSSGFRWIGLFRQTTMVNIPYRDSW